MQLHSWAKSAGSELTILKRIFAGLMLAAIFATTVIGQNTNSNKAASPSPTPAPTPFPQSNVITQADATAARLRDISTFLNNRPDNFEIVAGFPDLERQINSQEPETAVTLQQRPSLDELNRLQGFWQTFNDKLQTWDQTLRDQLGELDQRIGELGELGELWRQTEVALTPQAIASGTPDSNRTTLSETPVPDEVKRRIADTIVSIRGVRTAAERDRAELLALQSKLSELESRTENITISIKERRRFELSRLFVRDSPPVWAIVDRTPTSDGVFAEMRRTVNSGFSSLGQYAAGHVERFVLHGLAILLLYLGFYWAGKRIVPIVENEPNLERSTTIFQHPAAAAVLFSIFLSGFLYEQAPRLLTTLMGLALLVPILFLLPRLIPRTFYPLLYALVAFYFFDRIRDLVSGIDLLARIFSMSEMLASFAFFAWVRRSKRLAARVEAGNHRSYSIVRGVAPFAMAIFAVAFFANLFGFVNLSSILANGVLRSSYLALVLFTAYRIINGLVIFALRVRPLSQLNMVIDHRQTVRLGILRIVKWLAVIVWVISALYVFSIRDVVFTFIGDVLSASIAIGSVNLSVGHILTVIASFWVAILVSRFIRFVLKEDVYPRIDLGSGVSYAISTTLHYVILIAGFLFAIAALGFELSQFAIVLGAIGIGVGLGLQNIINNFVSGLILLFERPVKVGDTVQIGQHVGALKQIGLRASVLRKVDGSDVILPNSHLISEEVINWTMSDDKRRLDIEVGVAYGTDPELVLGILKKVATDNTDILEEPAPRALFMRMGESALNFELRAWTENSDDWVPIRSALVSSVYSALSAANIEIPFPQRDLHLRTVDAETIAAIIRKKDR